MQPILLGLCLLPAVMCAQKPAGEKELLDLMTGGSTRQWAVVGTTSAAGAACGAGEAYYTFQRAPAQVVVQRCEQGTWKPRTVPFSVWNANGKVGIAFGGASFEVRELHAGAPVCKGKANCIRLSSLPDGKTDATTNIYLTR